jgi:CcmD family protein
MIKKLLSLLFLLVSSLAQAQAAEPEMADALRESGKIYVVISVIAMIFLALVVFLVMLDRKLKKLEKKIK